MCESTYTAPPNDFADPEAYRHYLYSYYNFAPPGYVAPTESTDSETAETETSDENETLMRDEALRKIGNPPTSAP